MKKRIELFRCDISYSHCNVPNQTFVPANDVLHRRYEHKFHDWTQFKEVYDTTLDIKVGSDNNKN